MLIGGGRLPLCITYMSDCIKYWCKLLHMNDHRYPKRCYYMLKSLDNAGRLTWASHIKHLLFLYGFGFVWVSHQVADIDVFISTFKQRLIDCHKQNWNHLIQDSSRCIHYKEFKSLLNTERYLKINLPVKYRQALSRFRCASHTLNVELGRQNKIPFEQRICQFCFQNENVSVVECEFHVFFCCKRFDGIRNSYLFNWYSYDRNLPNFYTIMSSTNEETIYKTALYVEKLLRYYNISID